MKKVLSLILLVALILSATACGSSSNSSSDGSTGTSSKKNSKEATIVLNNGETVSKSAKDLMDINDKNEAQWDKNYDGAKITFTGKIKSIKTDAMFISGKGSIGQNQGANVIFFEEGWALVISDKNKNLDVADYNVGDKYTITSELKYAPAYVSDFMKQALGDRAVWVIGNDKIGKHNDVYGSITTTIEKAE